MPKSLRKGQKKIESFEVVSGAIKDKAAVYIDMTGSKTEFFVRIDSIDYQTTKKSNPDEAKAEARKHFAALAVVEESTPMLYAVLTFKNERLIADIKDDRKREEVENKIEFNIFQIDVFTHNNGQKSFRFGESVYSDLQPLDLVTGDVFVPIYSSGISSIRKPHDRQEPNGHAILVEDTPAVRRWLNHFADTFAVQAAAMLTAARVGGAGKLDAHAIGVDPTEEVTIGGETFTVGELEASIGFSPTVGGEPIPDEETLAQLDALIDGAFPEDGANVGQGSENASDGL